VTIKKGSLNIAPLSSLGQADYDISACFWLAHFCIVECLIGQVLCLC